MLLFVKEVEVSLVFVDDGSSDDTASVLKDICLAAEEGASYFSLPKNKGKAEAVRQGLSHAFSTGAEILLVIWTRDLATSLQEAETIIERLIASDKKVAMGARVALADRDIRRGLMRHYLGRAFATFASSGLKATFYDTQCGAKFLGEATVCSQNP